MTTKKTREMYNVQVLENVEINKKYVKKLRQNLGRTNTEETDDMLKLC